MSANYRKHDCHKCGNAKCNDEFSQFIPSFDSTFAGVVECENFIPAASEKVEAEDR